MIGEKISFPKTPAIVLLAALAAANILVWQAAIGFFDNSGIYFLDVGQGDSQLVILPGNVKVLIDGGRRNGMALNELSGILPPTDKYIDLLVMSHPHFDHFGGFIDVIEYYKIGAFITPGTRNETSSFFLLERTLKENDIPVITLAQGDRVTHGESRFSILWPDEESSDWDLDNASLVMELEKNGAITLFTGDIGFGAEERIVDFYDRKIDVLKVAHHGSRYSSSLEFLAATRPLVSIIGVGRNAWGHPTEEVLERLTAAGTKVYRTDIDGTIKIKFEDGKIRIFTGI